MGDSRPLPPIVRTAPVLSPPLRIRPPVPAFDRSEALGNIRFRHPAYDDAENDLINLYPFDSRGVHHETARVACCILADCAWDGFLSLTRDGDPVPLGPDDILTARSYYFRVPNRDDPADYKYPVVPSFNHFRFPSSLPTSWQELNAPVSRDRRTDDLCLVTRTASPLEKAHIIPAAQQQWWKDNHMNNYATRPADAHFTHYRENIIRLRQDVHTLWDAHRIALVPKQGAWVVHVLFNDTTNELQALYHNQQLQPVAGVAREYLLARFAMAVFREAAFALTSSRTPRRLRYISDDGVTKTEDLTLTQREDLFSPPNPRGKSTSRSPAKRQRSTGGIGDEDLCEDLCGQDDATTCCDDVGWDSDARGYCRDLGDDAAPCCPLEKAEDMDSDEMTRGRPRKRMRL
ncbi:hypothetical protein QBC39DRAFT_183271 [Podospora conica]|nr:hypothetical protein QBC39DRAFT_183271 [Schizothecium conicum]